MLRNVMKKIILDNSSAIFLARLGLFGVLSDITFITTKEIEQEINEGMKKGYRDAYIRKNLLKNGKIKIEKSSICGLEEKYKLHKADMSIVALAKKHSCHLATEDQQVQRVCRIEGIKVVNTAALIYYLYKQHKIERKQGLELLNLLGKWGYKKEAIIAVKEELLGDEE
jgi:rRNA-processing protein FCF1